jgi:UDP-glucose 4-epimerase
VRAVVTGGAGFIGSHVVDALLARGDEVHVLDDFSSGKRDNVPARARVHEGDIRFDTDRVFDEARPEVVFHLAAQADVRVSVERPEHDADVNIVGTLHVLEAARRHGAKIVFSSTGGAIYGECDSPAAEDHPRKPLAPYGVSKLAGEEYIAAWNRLYGAGHVSLRFGNVYGPRQDPHGEAGVIAIFLQRILAGVAPTIFGDGEQVRDFIYVADVAAANRAALEAVLTPGEPLVVNIATGVGTSVNAVWRTIERVARPNLRVYHEPVRSGDVRWSVLDPARARHTLGWASSVSVDEGLQRTWEWFAARAGGQAEVV